MTTATGTLTEFLLARIAEDRAATDHWPLDGPWGAHPNGGMWTDSHGRSIYAPRARVLADCEAKRLTVRFLSDLERGEFGDTMTSSLAFSVLCRMAAPYTDHPDYQPEWKP